MNRYGLVLLLLLIGVWFGPHSLTAQRIERMPEVEQELYGSKAYVNGDYETIKTIRQYWSQEIAKLQKLNKCELALTGNSDAVLKVTIPSRLLFTANDTILTSQVDLCVRPFLRLVRGESAVATLIVACHSDNNGSETYLRELTTARARSLTRWMGKQGIQASQVEYFGLSNQSPCADNQTIQSREMNRRVTLYFVPNRRMLKLAKRGKLLH